jgi:hypothetical protein
MLMVSPSNTTENAEQQVTAEPPIERISSFIADHHHEINKLSECKYLALLEGSLSQEPLVGKTLDPLAISNFTKTIELQRIS